MLDLLNKRNMIELISFGAMNTKYKLMALVSNNDIISIHGMNNKVMWRRTIKFEVVSSLNAQMC